MGAELGQEIGLLLESVAKSNVDTQIISCTCHELDSVSDGWTAVPCCGGRPMTAATAKTCPHSPEGWAFSRTGWRFYPGRIAESGDILADYRAVLASARRNGVSISKATRKEARAAMRPIERMRALARLQLYLTLLNAGYGSAS